MKYKENFAEKFINSFMGKNAGESREKLVIPHISSMLKDLINVPDDKWGIYAFRREPLKGKFSEDEKKVLIGKANECGRKYGEKIRLANEGLNVYEIAEKLGLEVDYPDRPNGGGHILFAQFVEPNKITIFKDSVNKALDLIEKENLSSYFSNINIEEILLAHEIFHFIEERCAGDIFSKTEKIRLWKFGPIKNDSNILCLGEIAGMAFAKELLKLQYSPYILDSFLVYLYNEEVAYRLYNEIMKINK